MMRLWNVACKDLTCVILSDVIWTTDSCFHLNWQVKNRPCYTYLAFETENGWAAWEIPSHLKPSVWQRQVIIILPINLRTVEWQHSFGIGITAAISPLNDGKGKERFSFSTTRHRDEFVHINIGHIGDASQHSFIFNVAVPRSPDLKWVIVGALIYHCGQANFSLGCALLALLSIWIPWQTVHIQTYGVWYSSATAKKCRAGRWQLIKKSNDLTDMLRSTCCNLQPALINVVVACYLMQARLLWQPLCVANLVTYHKLTPFWTFCKKVGNTCQISSDDQLVMPTAHLDGSSAPMAILNPVFRYKFACNQDGFFFTRLSTFAI